MKIVFAHDHRFISTNGAVYSENHFGAGFWDRFLGEFDRLTVLGREATLPTGRELADLTLSSRAEVDFALLPNVSSARGWLFARRRVAARISEIVARHDAVVARLPSEIGLMALSAARTLGIPSAIEVVGCGYDVYAHYGSRLGAVYAPLARHRMRHALGQATHAIYVTKEFLQHRYPAPRAMTEIASNVELVGADPKVLDRRIERIGRADDAGRPLTLGLVGSLRTRTKGIQVALRALADRRAALPPFRFRVLGGGDRAEWRAEAAALGLADVVSFDGSLSDPRKVLSWLDEVDIYLQPSLQEGLPRALIEAMSRGCPALGSQLAGIPELLDRADLSPPGDHAALGDLLLRRVGDRSWMAARAARNFRVARDYEQPILDARRSRFWRAFAEHVRNRSSH